MVLNIPQREKVYSEPQLNDYTFIPKIDEHSREIMKYKNQDTFLERQEKLKKPNFDYYESEEPTKNQKIKFKIEKFYDINKIREKKILYFIINQL